MRNTETYASITSMTTSQPIHELKRVYNNLFEVQKQENVYIKKTKLETTDTVELVLGGITPFTDKPGVAAATVGKDPRAN